MEGERWLSILGGICRVGRACGTSECCYACTLTRAYPGLLEKQNAEEQIFAPSNMLKHNHFQPPRPRVGQGLQSRGWHLHNQLTLYSKSTFLPKQSSFLPRKGTSERTSGSEMRVTSSTSMAWRVSTPPTSPRRSCESETKTARLGGSDDSRGGVGVVLSRSSKPS